MKVVSWNVAGRVGSAPKQLERVLGRSPDVIALQEVRPGKALQIWSVGLESAGYSFVSSAALIARAYPAPPYPADWYRGRPPRTHLRRAFFNLTASRHAIYDSPGLAFRRGREKQHAFPEKYLVAQVNVDGALIGIHNAHLPPGSSRG